jgi:energy-coupling factor transporter ATP-binding protein EcfA2
MKIRTIQVGQFGVWQQLSLAVPERGVALFYGPNEAGKSTLLRFIRSMLYGFEPFAVELSDGSSRPVGWEGVLRVESQGHEYEIRRVWDRGTRGLVSVVGTDREQPAESLLSELLFHTDESLYENVFAVGLNELQELATLQGDEVARHIYGLTLGPTGRKLLDATATVDQARRNLLDPASRSGRLADLLEREQSLREEIAAQHSLREEHAEQCRERNRIENRIESLQKKQGDVEQQLAGHRLLARVWPHWSEARDIRQELDSIPEVSGFPADGLERLHKLDAHLDAAGESRRTLVESVKALRGKLHCFAGHKELHTHAPALVGFVEQAGWYRDVTQQAASAKSRADEIRPKLDRSLEALGPDWTLERLESLDTGLGARRRLLSSAARYRAALRRRNRMLRLRKRFNRALGKRSAALDEQMKTLGDRPLDEVIAEQHAHVKGFEELAGLRLKEADLSARRERLNQPAPDQPEPLPPFIPKFLTLLFVAGLLVTVVGLIQAAAMDVIAGLGMGFIGFCGLGIAWGFRHHLDAHTRRVAETDGDQPEQLDAELAETRAAIARLTANPQTDASSESAPDDAELHRQAIARLAELERWNRTKRGLRARRRRLSELRTRSQSVQRDLSTERQSWCQLLKDLGHSETVKIDEALDAWDRAAEARDHLRAWKAASDEHRHLDRSIESFHARMAEAGRRAGRGEIDGKPPLDVLATWDGELKSLGIVRDEYRRTRRDLKDHRRKATQAARRLRKVRSRLAALFAEAGASDHKSFVERASWLERRQECQGLLDIANEDLRKAAAEEPELAIVEDDLENFDADANQERLESLAAELDEIDRDRQAAFEELGGVKQTLKSLEADCEASRLRFAASQNRHELARTAEEWFGIELTRQAIDRVRSKFERTCQPATLALASKYLEKLTRGRYRNVWTPLGQRELRIDDERGQSLSIEQLSGGTREQLFLAVRMATVHELGQKGIDLPMVFDDVLVNFDQLRTEAAVDTLCEFAEENRQILFFTCHLHLAHLFESRGVEPLWLPGHNLPQQERRAG